MPPPSKLTRDEVLRIYTSGEPGAVLAKRYGISEPAVHYIRTAKTHAAITRGAKRNEPKVTDRKYRTRSG